MPEADVVYSDVQFTKPKENVTASLPNETTYAEVRILKTEPSAELPAGSQQQATSSGGSKVKSERVAIAVLSALLVAAVIVLGFIYYKNLQITKRLQELTAENTNLKERSGKVKGCNIVQPPDGKIAEKTCEEGWEQHGVKCYYFSTDKSTWEKAREGCRYKGGDLVKIDSGEEQSFLVQKMREKMNEDEDKFWIGLTDSKEEGKWLWTDGSPLSLAFWSHKEPDNWTREDRDGEDCVRMGERTGAGLNYWHDKTCKAHQRSVCEKSAGCRHQDQV